MFKLDPKWLVIGVLIAGLAGYWHWTTAQLEHYRTLSREQSAQINELQHHIALRNQALETERKITREQTALEAAEREKADDDVKVIYKTVVKTDCGNTALPSDVIKRLRNASGKG